MKKLFISQPMRNKTEEEILREREMAISEAKAVCGENIKVIDSYFQEESPETAKRPLWFLGKSILLLSTADIAYFARGWNRARGCLIENQCAHTYGIEVIEVYEEE